MSQNRIRPMTLTSISSASITGSYQPINTSGFDGACFVIRIMNATDQGILISYDGVNDHEAVLSTDTLQLDFQNNAQPNAWTALASKGQKIYVKGTAGTGTVFLSGYYVAQ